MAQLVLFVSFNISIVSVYYLCHQKIIRVLNTSKSVGFKMCCRGRGWVVKMG